MVKQWLTHAAVRRTLQAVLGALLVVLLQLGVVSPQCAGDLQDALELPGSWFSWSNPRLASPHP